METLFKVLLDKYRLQIGVFLVAAILVSGGALALMNVGSRPSEVEKVAGTVSSVSEPTESTASNTPIPAVTKIKIDLAGAVVNPGVYELPEDSRVEEALNAAGGLSEQADRDWVSKNLNLAAKLHDGDKCYIPKVGETSSQSSAGLVSGTETPPASGGESASGRCSRVNINTASAGTLSDCLLGIGTTKAQSIIKYREEHGGFKSIEEIQEVSGIGPKTFEKIKGQITVD